MRNIFSYFATLIFVIFICYFWEFFKIDFNNNIEIYGEYFQKKYNPINDIIRFLIIIIPSLIIFIILNKFYYQLLPSSKNFFLKKHNIDNQKSFLKFYTFFFNIYIY